MGRFEGKFLAPFDQQKVHCWHLIATIRTGHVYSVEHTFAIMVMSAMLVRQLWKMLIFVVDMISVKTLNYTWLDAAVW